MAKPRISLADELEEMVPVHAAETEQTADEKEAAEAAARVAELLGEARAFLGLDATASREEVQANFGAGLQQHWEFFFGEYRLDENDQEVPGAPFHLELMAEIQALILSVARGAAAAAAGKRLGQVLKELAKACPREHAKSVIALVAVIWALANKHREFAFLFSDTDGQALGLIEDIKIEIEGNERLAAVYPEFCEYAMLPRLNRLVLKNGTLVMAAGSGRSVRGARKRARRPDFIVLDDIENDDEVENPSRRRKKMTWYTKVVRKLGRAAVYLIVGTILHADSFLAARIKRQPDPEQSVYRAIARYPAELDGLWAEWEKVFHDFLRPDRETAALAFYEVHREAMDAGAEVLWPAKFSLYELMVERAEDLASFLSERQNDPFDPAASYFPEESLRFVAGDEKPGPDQVRMSVAFWDPSRGTSKSDMSAFFRLDVLKDGRRFVSEGIAGRIPPEEVIDTIVGYHRVRAFEAVGVEKVGLSNYDGDLQRVSRLAGVAVPVQPVTPQGEKGLRIKSLRPLIVSGGLFFSDDLPLEAKRQLKYFPQHSHDDVCDAIQQASTLADQFLVEVRAAASQCQPGAAADRVSAADALGHPSAHGDAGIILMPSPADRVGAGWMERLFGGGWGF